MIKYASLAFFAFAQSPSPLKIVALVLLCACADPVERDIAALIAGGEGAEEARMNLNMAKATAITPLVAAFGDQTYSPRARIELAQALYRLHLREKDPRIMTALIAGLNDGEQGVRAGVAQALGDLGRAEGITPLIARLEVETVDAVCHAILTALESVGTERDRDNLLPDRISAEDKGAFTAWLVQLRQGALADSLRGKVVEWLETLAEERAREARELALKADLVQAEEVLLTALELVPDSKNINYQLGRFYYDNGEEEKGLEILQGQGLVARAARLAQKPRIDGVLDEEVGRGVEPLREFYQCIYVFRAHPINGRAEVYVGHADNVLYVTVKGYEPRTDNLRAEVTADDRGGVANDDCAEVFLDPDFDHRSFYQFIVNSNGALADIRYDHEQGGWQNWNWGGDFEVAASVADTFWTAEFAIPVAELDAKPITRGTIWGFNVARVRIANDSEYGQWTPTFGWALRPHRFGLLIFN